MNHLLSQNKLVRQQLSESYCLDQDLQERQIGEEGSANEPLQSEENGSFFAAGQKRSGADKMLTLNVNYCKFGGSNSPTESTSRRVPFSLLLPGVCRKSKTRLFWQLLG